MADVTPLRAVPNSDGYRHRDVILDADGVWWQRTTAPEFWLGFGGVAAHADLIPQPWTLVAHANEVASLKTARDARFALVEENLVIREAADVVVKHNIDNTKECSCAGCDAIRDLHDALLRTDPLRGGA